MPRVPRRLLPSAEKQTEPHGKARPRVRAWFITRVHIEEVSKGTKDKRDHVPLELAQLRPEARLPTVRGPHSKLMITAGEVELGEEARPPRAVEQCVDVRERLDSRA